MLFIINYTDKFYYDDDSGESIFGIKISKYSTNIPYSDISKYTDSRANFIPVQFDSKIQEDFIKEFLAKGMEKYNEWKDKEKYNITPLVRYIRIEVEKDGISYTYIDGKEK